MMTDQQTSTFAGSGSMGYREAFAAQGAEGIGRRQWSRTADDDVEVVTIWLDRLDGDNANSDLNRNALPRYYVGQTVRAVLCAPYTDDRADGAKVRRAWPDLRHDWRVAGIEGTVLHLTAVDAPNREALIHAARTKLAEIGALLDQIEAAVCRTAGHQSPIPPTPRTVGGLAPAWSRGERF